MYNLTSINQDWDNETTTFMFDSGYSVDCSGCEKYITQNGNSVDDDAVIKELTSITDKLLNTTF